MILQTQERVAKLLLVLCLLVLVGCRSDAESSSAADKTGPIAGDDQRSEAENSPVKTSQIESVDTSELLEISFDDLKLPIQPDIVFRPFMLTDRVKEMDGRRVHVSGYMLPDDRRKGIKQFVLLRNKECKFGPGGQADHLINVTLNDNVTAAFTDRAIVVKGVLTINPFNGTDGNTWSIYDLAGESVKSRRR